MEESLSPVKILSRKRKKISTSSSTNSNTFMGISTRSKSRIYFHLNSSGISRSDPVPSKPIPDSESVEAYLDMNCSDASRVSSIKDLRMKRVFTPVLNSVPQEEKDEEEKNEERKKLLKGSDASGVEDERNDMADALNLKDQAISGNGSLSKSKMALNRCFRRKVFKSSSSFSYRRLLPYLMDIVNDASSVSKIEIVDAGISCGLQKLNDVNSEERSTAENTDAIKIEHVVSPFDDSKPSENQDLEKVHIMEQKGYVNDMNGVDASAEEDCIQTTPPDPGIFTKTEVGCGRESMEADKVLAENQTFMGLSVGSEKSNGDALKQSPNSKCSTNSMNRSVLNPCSQLRLFKNRRSLSYRRLLPFLMDISKNNSCASRNTQNLMPHVVSEEDYVNKNETENSYEKQHTEDFSQDSASSTVPLSPSDGSSPDTNDILMPSKPQSSSANYSSNLEPIAVTSETLPEEIPRTQSSSTKSELGLEWKDCTSPSEPSSIVSHDILTKQCTSQEPESFGKQKMCLDMGLELHNSNAESIEHFNLKRNSFQVEALDASVSLNNRPPKGILKRNRLGCRGLCNCLNCASFRLHADRAFEFSRNQMHDAEEVASELMKELANLRLLLEKSIIKTNESADIQLDPVLIKQACNKAMEAEELAKGRFSELNYDLNVHCRIPTLLQPKVTFANNVQERAIPVLDASSRTEKKG